MGTAHLWPIVEGGDGILVIGPSLVVTEMSCSSMNDVSDIVLQWHIVMTVNIPTLFALSQPAYIIPESSEPSPSTPCHPEPAHILATHSQTLWFHPKPTCVLAMHSQTCHDRDRTYPYLPYPDLSMPIPSHQNHSRAPNAKPEPSGSIPSQLVSNASPNPLTPSHPSNALLNTLTPLGLADAFLTRRTFNLSSSLRQVDSRHPHSFPTRRHSTFTLLRQVHSRHFISLATAVRWSPIAYLPCSMCLSLSFLALYISICSLCLIICYPPFISLSHPQFPISIYPHLIYLYSISLLTLFSYPVHSLDRKSVV